MKITKRVREQAALICAIAASNTNLPSGALSAMRGLQGWRDHDTKYGTRLRSRQEEEHPALLLVTKAFAEARKSPAAFNDYGTQDWPAQMAEAEAMLRTGWTP